jgi:hypothetical protein
MLPRPAGERIRTRRSIDLRKNPQSGSLFSLILPGGYRRIVVVRTSEVRRCAMGAGAITESERYWLGHCEGFRVDAPGGRLGLVEAVLYRREDRTPDALVVRAGLLGRKLLLVPARSVEAVQPRQQRIRLSASPKVGGTDFLADLIRRVDAGEEHVVTGG